MCNQFCLDDVQFTSYFSIFNIDAQTKQISLHLKIHNAPLILAGKDYLYANTSGWTGTEAMLYQIWMLMLIYEEISILSTHPGWEIQPFGWKHKPWKEPSMDKQLKSQF